jgi:hypothetical protein
LRCAAAISLCDYIESESNKYYGADARTPSHLWKNDTILALMTTSICGAADSVDGQDVLLICFSLEKWLKVGCVRFYLDFFSIPINNKSLKKILLNKSYECNLFAYT